MRNLCLALLHLIPTFLVAQTQTDCYKTIKFPAIYDVIIEQRLKSEVYTTLTPVSATYELVEEEFLVKEGTNNGPAVYETVTEYVLVKEASTRIEVIPAVLETVLDSIEIKPKDCDAPAIYKHFEKEILKCPATTRSITIPSEWITVTKQVIISLAHEGEVIAPEYRTLQKQWINTPATTRELPVPATYLTFKSLKLKRPCYTKQIKVSCLDSKYSGPKNKYW